MSAEERPSKFRKAARGRTHVGNRADAGEQLGRYILSLYSKGGLPAKAVCEMCHFAVGAGAEGRLLENLALRPGQACTGNFKRHLDKQLAKSFPSIADCPQTIQVPVWLKGSRASKTIPVAAAYDVLESEVLARPGAYESLRRTTWPRVCDQHVHRHIPGDTRACFPVSVYADGVQCTKQHGAGKSDSLIAFTCTNLAVGKRHLLAVVSKRELCSCGCSGWCTLHEIFRFITHCLAAAAQGQRPSLDMHGFPWLAVSDEGIQAKHSPDFAARFVPVEVKAGWAEMLVCLGSAAGKDFISHVFSASALPSGFTISAV